MTKKLTSFIFLFLILSGITSAQIPEILYYRFNEAGADSTQNFAAPGSGFAWAQVMGAQTMGQTGQFGTALIGAGGSGGTDYVNTGWNMNVGTSSWTISLWINNYGASTFGYIFGNDITTSFRCFSAGAAGTGNITLRGNGVTSVDVTGVLPGPSVVHFVYDATVPEIRAYVNGVLQSSVPQAALNINASVPFKIGSYGTSTSIPVDALLDEFRFYNRALDATEIAATWNDPLPVELTSFTASVFANDVTLLWETATEINNNGFSVERKSTAEFESIGYVPGFGTTTEPKSYSFVDSDLPSGKYTYRIKQIDYDGTYKYSNEIEVEVKAPAEYSLQQNYPNPFNPSTTINFNLASDAKVILKVYDVLGQEVAQLLNTELTAGSHQVDFEANLNSGVYFFELNAKGIDGTEFSDVKKMILSK